MDFGIARVVSTDPPYYDNIGYADLSDFFYVWLRHSMRLIFPDLFATVRTPKTEELVATPARHGGKEKAEDFFLKGMTNAMHRLTEQSHPAFPVTIFYAFKRAETDGKRGAFKHRVGDISRIADCCGFYGYRNLARQNRIREQAQS